MKSLVLFKNVNEYYFDHYKNNDIEIRGVFTKTNTIGAIIIKLLKKIKSPLIVLFYDSWYQNLEFYDKIIVFDSALHMDHSLLRNIDQKVKTEMRYLYSWNIIKDKRSIEFEKSEAANHKFVFYHYDRLCCKQYNLKFNTIMYDPTLKIPNGPIEYDTLFLGFVKDRKEDLMLIYSMFKEEGLNPNFIVVGYNKEDIPFKKSQKYINYYEYLQMFSQSNSILDVTQNNQRGLSMRVMEAIFFNKKLISTNLDLKNCDFYDNNKILVYEKGKTTGADIKNFLSSGFEPYSDKIRRYYSFESWVERFK